MPRRKTQEEFINEVSVISPDIEILGTYINSQSSIRAKCKHCGKVWEPKAGDLLAGKGCRQCRIKLFSKKRTKTNEQFLYELFNINSNIEPLETYVNSHTKIRVRCKECGYTWKSTPKDLLHGYGCKKCSIRVASANRRITYKEFVERINQTHPNIILLETYTDLQSNLKVKCKICGYIWTSKASNLLHGSNCPNCSKEKVASIHRKNPNDFKKEIFRILPSVSLLDEYRNYTTPINCLCLICGYKWRTKPQSLLNGHGCIRCSRSGTSFMEQFIYHSFAEVIGKNNAVSRDRKTIGMELDIFIPSLKLAIEPGSWSFHKYSVTRDANKRKICKQNGIRLITVYDSFPSNEKIPFTDDCIVFDQDYKIADHKHIRDLVLRLFNMAKIEASFNDNIWEKIEQQALEDSRAKNTDDFINEINLIRDDVEIIGLYFGSKIPIETKCKKCGNIWNPRPANLLNGTNCPICSKNIKVKKQTKSHEQFIDELKQLQPNIIVLSKYKKNKAHIDVECKICNTQWSPVAASLLNGEGCPKCGLIRKANKRRKTQEQYEEELFRVNPDLEVIGKYTGTLDPIEVRCKICGYEWSRVARKLLYSPHHRNEKQLHNK